MKEVLKLVNWIDDIPKDNFYISNLGNLYNKFNRKITMTYNSGLDNRGVYIIYYKDKSFTLHPDRLVLHAFDPRSDENLLIPYHKDRNINNNNFNNLEWTNKDQYVEIMRHNTKLTKIHGEDVKEIDWIDWIPKHSYYISKNGNVYSWQKKKLVIDTRNCKEGRYNLVDKTGYTRSVNPGQLVLEAFSSIKNKENFIPFHINGDSQDNRIENLIWRNFKDIINDKYKIKSNNYKEIIKPINWINWLPKDKYYVSNKGKIYNSFGKEMSYYYSQGGYAALSLRDIENKSHQLLVSRLVLQTFNPIENYNNMTVDHIDSNPLNNNLENLQWLSFNNNVKKRESNNKFRDYHINYEQKERDVLKLFKEGKSKKEIYLLTGMNRNYINRILKENNIDESQYNQGNHKFNINTLFNLVLVFSFGDINNEKLGKEYNCNKNSISNLRNCNYYAKDLESLGYTKTHKPYSIIDYEYDLNDINPDSEYTFFN